MNDNWNLIMVGDFMDCTSCDESCGHVWFVKAMFDKQLNMPCCINTRISDGKTYLVPHEIGSWCPERVKGDFGKEALKEFIKASNGPVYRLSDFVKGGAYEEAILKYRKFNYKRMKAIGLEAIAERRADIPEQILWPIVERY